METVEARVKRFLNSDTEMGITLVNSIHNFFVKTELAQAVEKMQYNLLFLGIHSVMQTVSEKLFGKWGMEGTKFYLENFADGPSEDRRFSLVADEIHDVRNVFAHQWFSAILHRINLDDRSDMGWVRNKNELTINPLIYFEQFNGGFAAGGRVWKWMKLCSPSQLKIGKYRFVADYLGVGTKKSETIRAEIAKIERLTGNELDLQETKVKNLLIKYSGQLDS